MKKILRSTALVAGSAAAMLIPTTPASAANAAEFNGVANIGCFGCGTYGPDGNDANFCVNGTILGITVSGGVYTDPSGAAECNGDATFTVNEPVGPTCVASGTASGSISVDGVGTTSFNWTRTGAHAVITTGWGTATAVFHVTSPVGNPCGFAVRAEFSGALAGA